MAATPLVRASTPILCLLALGCAPEDVVSADPTAAEDTPTTLTAGMQPRGDATPADDAADAESGAPDTADRGTGYPAAVTDVLALSWPPPAMATPLPAHLAPAARLDNSPRANPVTDAGATLGRVLFYDVNLSANSAVSCASCHPQQTAFSDTTPTSLGFAGDHTGRNSMPIVNLRYRASGDAFWDARADSLEAQALGPIQDAVEMGLTLSGLERRVAEEPAYVTLFEDAFGDADITAARVGDALAQFVRALVSTGSRFDEGLALTGDVAAPFPTFTAEENQGKALFYSGRTGCAVCHTAPGMPALLLGQVPRNNGLDPASADLGVGAVTGRPQDARAFLTPSLRNIALSAPFMHDGRFDTLDDVVDFYDRGVRPDPNLDPVLRGPGGAPRRLGLRPDERAALVAFLETLTDDAFTQDARFSDPWR
jgi:cytochrome c peroxidase